MPRLSAKIDRNAVILVVPSTFTNTGLLRVSRNSTSYTDVSDNTFTILNQPAVTLTNACTGYVNLSWGAITLATSYDIMMLKGNDMVVVGNTTGTSYLLGGLNKDSTYWLSVRPVVGTTYGRRAIAQSIMMFSPAVR